MLRIIHFNYTLATLAWTKKIVHLEMRNLKQTEFQRLKNRGKKAEGKTRKDRARRRLRNTKPRLELRSPHNVSTFYPSSVNATISSKIYHIQVVMKIMSCLMFVI